MDVAAPTITDWIGAISGIVAAVGGVGTLIIAIVLISKQHASLTKTIELAEKQSEVLDGTLKSLADEKQARDEDRERYKRAPAESVVVDVGSTSDNNKILSGPLYRGGLQLDAITYRAKVVNNCSGNITNVAARVKQALPKCYVLDGEGEYREGNMPVVPPGKGASIYWIGTIEDSQQLEVWFTDEAGVRWSKHRLNGLSEVTGQE